MKRFDSSDGNVFKYVFSKEDFVAETVLYRYENFYKRTVICCSTMSGCPVGCTFCGTGNRLVRNLTADEIIGQIDSVLKDQNIDNVDTFGERFQNDFLKDSAVKLLFFEGECPAGLKYVRLPSDTVIMCKKEYSNSYIGIKNLKIK